MCRYGRKAIWTQARIRAKKKGARNLVKRMLKSGDWDNLPTTVDVGYIG